jgi:hypothetical protein
VPSLSMPLMQGHGRGKLLVQAAEKFQEFLMSVSLITLSYDLALRQFPGQRTAW